MKKCPYCGAKIEENAKVCLYCMKELQEKEQFSPFRLRLGGRWLFAALSLLLALLLAAGAFFLLREKDKVDASAPKQEQTEQPLESGEAEPEKSEAGKKEPSQKEENESSSQKENAVSNQQNSSDQKENSSGGQGGGGKTEQNATPSGNNAQQEGSDTKELDKKEEGSAEGNDSAKEDDSAKEEDTTGGGGSDDPAGDAPEKIEPEPDPEPAPQAAVFTYRDAEYAKDDYHVTANVDNCVVITGVSTPASNGIYRIPSTLGGKKVIAVDQSAFNAEGIRNTVKAVYVPASVRTIKAYAFSACYNLTDIYFYGASIYVDSQAFAVKSRRSGTLTIHCAYDCNNRDLRYYRNIAESYYDAKFEEWNG